MMARMQVTMNSETQRLVRLKAAGLGVSIAEYVRRLIANDLAGQSRNARPEKVFDLGSTGRSNIAKDKKAMIAEAIAGRRSAVR
jgi:hypothetical protein